MLAESLDPPLNSPEHRVECAPFRFPHYFFLHRKKHIIPDALSTSLPIILDRYCSPGKSFFIFFLYFRNQVLFIYFSRREFLCYLFIYIYLFLWEKCWHYLENKIKMNIFRRKVYFMENLSLSTPFITYAWNDVDRLII